MSSFRRNRCSQKCGYIFVVNHKNVVKVFVVNHKNVVVDHKIPGAHNGRLDRLKINLKDIESCKTMHARKGLILSFDHLIVRV